LELPDYARPFLDTKTSRYVVQWVDGVHWELPEKHQRQGGLEQQQQAKGKNILEELKHGNKMLTIRVVSHANRGNWDVPEESETRWTLNHKYMFDWGWDCLLSSSRFVSLPCDAS
jgi:hypothetical protein